MICCVGGASGTRGEAPSGAPHALERVRVELSPAQVRAILGGAAHVGVEPALGARLRVVREAFGRGGVRLDDGRLSRSLLSGLLILAAMPSDGGYVSNAQIARVLGMKPSTAHRYVSTLLAAGLLERDPSSRRYRLA
jgi:hypothetical protein